METGKPTIKDSKQRKIGILLSYVNILASVVISFFYTRYLFANLNGGGETATTQYGLKTFVESMTVWLSVFSTALSSSYIRFATIQQKKEVEAGLSRTNANFFALFLMASVVCFLVGFLVFFLFKIEVIPLANYSVDERNTIVLLFLISFFSSTVSIFFSLFSCYLTFKQKFIWLRSLTLFVTIFRPLISALFIYLGYGVVVLTVIVLSFTFLEGVANFVVAKANRFQVGNLFKFDKGLIHDIFSFSGLIVITAAIGEINSYTDQTVLGFFRGPKFVTIYQIGQSLVTYLAMASISVSNVFIPKVNQLVSDNDLNALNDLFIKIAKIQMVIVFTIIGGFSVCGQEFIVAWVGQDKSESFFIGLTLFLLSSVEFTQIISIEIQRAMNKHKFRCFSYLAFTLINIVITIICVAFFPENLSYFGCLLGTAISVFGESWIAMTIYNQKAIGLDMKKYWSLYARFLCLTGISVGLCFLIKEYAGVSFISKWGAFLMYGSIFVVFQIPLLIVFNLSDTKKVVFTIRNFLAKARGGK